MKKIKVYLNFRIHALSKIPEVLETDAYEFNFQNYRETEISQIIKFWSNCKIPWNVIFRLNHEIKMPQNSKVVQKSAKLKCRENFMPQNFYLKALNGDIRFHIIVIIWLLPIILKTNFMQHLPGFERKVPSWPTIQHY